MLDREYVIVAKHPQCGDKLFPPLRAMSIAAGAKYPSTIPLIGVGLSVEYSCPRQISWVELRVLGMNVEDRLAKNSDGCIWIDALPKTCGLVRNCSRPPAQLANAASASSRGYTRRILDASPPQSSPHAPKRTPRVSPSKVQLLRSIATPEHRESREARDK